MSQFASFLNALGGSAGVKKQPIRKFISLRAEDFVSEIRLGLPSRMGSQVIKLYGLNDRQADKILGFSRRTLTRKLQASKRLTPVQSDRVYRLARVGAHALVALGDPGKARDWMTSPNRALGNTAPVDLLDTDAGAERVEEILHRIEHGIYS